MFATDIGNYHGRPFVLGGDLRNGNNKVEMLTMETLEWEQMEDYPFEERFASIKFIF